MPQPASTREHERLAGKHGDASRWRRWGPYVSERSWGTVREDYSADGNAWAYLTHDRARSKAYRWGEDGLAAICDRYQILVWSLALWNERDPILKERLFGLIPSEGNHGEDVKEYYFYLDSTPTHSYMKWLYKYPQREYPYAWLVEENRRRAGRGPEFEVLDTGIFDDDRYFDIFVEYGKASPEDIVIRVTVENRGPDDAPLRILPHLCFRNTWAWGPVPGPEPSIALGPSSSGVMSFLADDSTAAPPKNLPFLYRLGPRYLYIQEGGRALFTDNETNGPRVYGPGALSRTPFVKDAFHRHLVHGEPAVNPAGRGTKAAMDWRAVVPARGRVTLRMRLSSEVLADPLGSVDAILTQRLAEADEFYGAIQPSTATPDERLVQRQAFAGMLWSKQIYLFDVNLWLDGDNLNWPPPRSRLHIRNSHWRHLNSMRVLSMPDKWEYPWFAAWDLAFHTAPLALVDPDFAKEQLWLLLFEQFQHSSGQVPAYEWEFSDLNPPVHAWAVWRVYNMDRLQSGRADREFLEKCFHKLLINFAWWVNKVDRAGNNVFEGGFLGLDNITVIDRSDRLPQGVVLEQSDATGWMGMFCLNLMRIALELAKENRAYQGLATKFFEHYIYVGAAMKRMGGRNYQLWDEKDGFFYDVLRYPDASFHKFRVRSLVGLIPLYAVERLEERWIEPFQEFRLNFHWFLTNKAHIVQNVCHPVKREDETVHVLAVVDQEQMMGLLRRILDADEFLSPFGLRSLSKHHEAHPFHFGQSHVRYEPGEAESKIKGGNSNWRGPVWFPTTFLMIESLRKLGTAYGPTLQVPADGRDGPLKSLRDVAEGLANRLIRIFTRDASGRRPVYGSARKFQEDPHWRDLILFYEYYHADTGEGLGASHQTGWTGLVASLIDEWRQ
ncbi:MAG: MGH1-like glycoside hydrolase domain-containing protein [Candidatus Rokuibacteriota bacterium]